MECVTIVGCVVSVVSLVTCMISFLAFRDVRHSISSIVHVNLCFSLLLSEVLVLINLDASNFPRLCAVLAAFLHFFCLATFTWNAIEAFNVYLTFIKVRRCNSSVPVPLQPPVSVSSSYPSPVSMFPALPVHLSGTSSVLIPYYVLSLLLGDFLCSLISFLFHK